MSGILAALSSFSNPLVIVDELGRGTSPEEGVGIAHAIAEEIIKSKVCYVSSACFLLWIISTGRLLFHNSLPGRFNRLSFFRR